MSLRGLVAGGSSCTGYGASSTSSGRNPLANLFSAMLQTSQQHHALGDLQELSPAAASERFFVPEQFSERDKAKIRTRAGVLVGQVFPGQRGDFVDNQLRAFLGRLNIDPAGVAEATSSLYKDEHRLQSFLDAGGFGGPPMVSAPPFALARPLEGPASSDWVNEFHASSHAGVGATDQWAHEFTSAGVAGAPGHLAPGGWMQGGPPKHGAQLLARTMHPPPHLPPQPFVAGGSVASMDEQMARLWLEQGHPGGPASSLEHQRRAMGAASRDGEVGAASAWVAEFAAGDGASAGGMGMVTQPAGSIMMDGVRHAQAGAAEGDWVGEFLRGTVAAASGAGGRVLHGQGVELGGEGAADWAAEFVGGQGAAEHAKGVADGSDWADEFEAGTEDGKTRRRGPHPDDPLEDKTALSWVEQYNRHIDGQVTNPVAKDPGLSYAFSEDNPYQSHTSPYLAGVSLLSEGRAAEAVLAFEVAVRKGRPRPQDWTMLGLALMDCEDRTKATVPLKTALLLDPSFRDALVALAVHSANEMRTQQAMEYMQRWAATFPPTMLETGPLLARGPDGSLTLATDLQQRIEGITRAHAHDPDGFTMQGLFHLLQDRPESALASFRSAVHLQPDDPRLLNKLAAVLSHLGKHQEAADVYAQAIKVCPGYVKAWSNLGVSQANLGRYEDAARCYLKAASLNRASSSIWDALHLTFTIMGRLDLAMLTAERQVDAFRKDFKF